MVSSIYTQGIDGLRGRVAVLQRELVYVWLPGPSVLRHPPFFLADETSCSTGILDGGCTGS